jgi:sterol desaturase/sphingolipid hydroxylase (fatty acid hydroxylase superfamily)
MKELIGEVTGIFTVQIVRYFILAGVPFAIVYIWLNKWFAKSKIQNKNANKADFIREILYSLQSTFILSLIGYIVFATPLTNYTKFYKDINKYPFWWIGVSTVLSLILQDTYFYWMHRTLHHKALFKYTHLVHHKSTNPSPWSSYSFHFFEAWTEGAILMIIAVILPINLVTVLLFTMISFIINVYGHLGYEIAPRWFRNSFLFQVTVSSVYHNMHHSKFNGNYGLYFRFWDKLMKTENPDYVKEYDRIQEARFGKNNTDIMERCIQQDANRSRPL